jgi:hypothetical protein
MSGKTTGAGAELRRILDGLGQTADEVATALQAKGIKGIRNAARYLNPIVRYAQSQVKIDALGLDVMKGDTLRFYFHQKKKEKVPLPQAVMQFLNAFNQGKYPELELPLDQS